MKSVQVHTRGEGVSEIGDFIAYVLYGCPLTLVGILVCSVPEELEVGIVIIFR